MQIQIHTHLIPGHYDPNVDRQRLQVLISELPNEVLRPVFVHKSVNIHQDCILKTINLIGHIVVVSGVDYLRKFFSCTFDVSYQFISESQIAMRLWLERSPIIDLFGGVQTVSVGVELLEVVGQCLVEESILQGKVGDVAQNLQGQGAVNREKELSGVDVESWVVRVGVSFG